MKAQILSEVIKNKGIAECPKCGHFSIVHHSDKTYRCLNCDFEKHFEQNTGSPNRELTGASLLLILSIFLILL